MICDICGKKATHKVQKTQNGITAKANLCDVCYAFWKIDKKDFKNWVIANLFKK